TGEQPGASWNWPRSVPIPKVKSRHEQTSKCAKSPQIATSVIRLSLNVRPHNMARPHLRDPVNVHDVLEQGACYDGVLEWLNDNDLVISGDPSQHPNEYIQRAAFAAGSGSGSGSGYNV